MQKIEQTLVLFRHLNTEPYIFTLQALERRAVPDHKSLLNATFKYIERGNPVFQNLYQQEVGIGRIDFESREFFLWFRTSSDVRKESGFGSADNSRDPEKAFLRRKHRGCSVTMESVFHADLQKFTVPGDSIPNRIPGRHRI